MHYAMTRNEWRGFQMPDASWMRNLRQNPSSTDFYHLFQSTDIMFLDTLCSKGVVFIHFSGQRFPVLIDIRLVTVNRHARCSL